MELDFGSISKNPRLERIVTCLVRFAAQHGRAARSFWTSRRHGELPTPIELHQAHTQYPWEIRQTTSRYLLQAEQSASIGLSGITQPDSGFPSLTTMPVIEYTLRPCRFNSSRLCRTYCFLIHLMSSICLTYSDCKKCALLYVFCLNACTRRKCNLPVGLGFDEFTIKPLCRSISGGRKIFLAFVWNDGYKLTYCLYS